MICFLKQNLNNDPIFICKINLFYDFFYLTL